MSKSIELAKKLLALAQRGVGGEKETAETLLARHMKAHGLTIEDIEGEKVDFMYYVFGGNMQARAARFFKQVCASIQGEERERTILTLAEKKAIGVKTPDKKTVVKFYFTPSEKIEIVETYRFFWDIYEKEEEVFYSAFVQKNELYSNPQKTKSSKNEDEDYEALLKMQRMANAMEKHTRIKTLNEG